MTLTLIARLVPPLFAVALSVYATYVRQGLVSNPAT